MKRSKQDKDILNHHMDAVEQEMDEAILQRDQETIIDMRYIGPDYVDGIWFGRKKIDIRSFSKEQAEDFIKIHPRAAKYFQFNN